MRVRNSLRPTGTHAEITLANSGARGRSTDTAPRAENLIATRVRTQAQPSPMRAQQQHLSISRSSDRRHTRHHFAPRDRTQASPSPTRTQQLGQLRSARMRTHADEVRAQVLSLRIRCAHTQHIAPDVRAPPARTTQRTRAISAGSPARTHAGSRLSSNSASVRPQPASVRLKQFKPASERPQSTHFRSQAPASITGQPSALTNSSTSLDHALIPPVTGSDFEHRKTDTVRHLTWTSPSK